MNSKLLVSVSVVSVFLLFQFVTPDAFAQLKSVTAPEGTAQGELLPSITAIVNVILGLVGILAGIMLIYGGVMYIISRGDDGAVENAKKTILYAVIGLIVIGLSAAIVNFVIGGFGGNIDSGDGGGGGGGAGN